MGIKKDVEDILLKAIEEAGGNLSLAADRLGVNPVTLWGWVKGGRGSKQRDALWTALDSIGVKLVPQGQESPLIYKPGGQPTEVKGEGLETIHVYDVAGAGPGMSLSEIEPMFSVTAPPAYFRMADWAILVDGHSMEPLIPHRAIVGVRRNAAFVANALYVANIPYEGLVVKRVGVDIEKKTFIFKSQNPDKESYPDFKIGIDEGEGIIIGRVVWIMIGY